MTEFEHVNGHSRDQIAIVSRRLERGIVLVVSGEIDLATAPAVERELMHAEKYHDLIAIDLSKVSFLDSTGLHAIMDSNLRLRERGGRLLIVEGPPQISRLFELTGLSDHLDLVGNDTELECLIANDDHARMV
ncbi:MAG: STAS domain-containing protein [Solirubrobacterales bacterium]|nr:STAS domain-containing protein [Solirubrobacterales bacterium]